MCPHLRPIDMKIAVRVPNWIGDCIQAVPAIESLPLNYPQAEIWIVARDWVKDVFSSFAYIQGAILVSGSSKLKTLRQEAQTLRSYNFDVGLLLTNSFGSALLFQIAKIPQRWGYGSDARRLLLTNRVPKKNPLIIIHQVQYYLDLISGLGLKSASPRLSFPLTPEDKNQAENLLRALGVDLKKQLIVLNPGAYYGSAKRWPSPYYSRLAAMLQESNSVEILIIGSSAETGLAKDISLSLENKPFLLTGKTSLRQLAGVLDRADLCVTNDSGPMHMATALGVPTLALFGPTDPRVTGPFQAPSEFIKKDVACWPCSYRECPFDHRCMEQIKPEEVFQACQTLLP
jgi:heptosyltransferase-2